MDNKLNSEMEVKKALGISNFANMTTDKVKEFFNLIPVVDKEVVLAIINQIPTFSETAKAMLSELEKTCDSALKSNDSSQNQTIEAYRKIIDTLSKQLEDGKLDSEEKKYCVEKMIEIADKISNKDTENKEFINGIKNGVLLGGISAAVGLIAVSMATLFGGRNNNSGLAS